MLSKTDASGVTQYAWDFENRLKQTTLPNGDVITYKCDALSRRIERTVSVVPLTTTTRFIYDGQDVIRDTDGNGVPTADYLGVIGATLQFLNDELNGTLRWETSSEGEFGFPISA